MLRWLRRIAPPAIGVISASLTVCDGSAADPYIGRFSGSEKASGTCAARAEHMLPLDESALRGTAGVSASRWANLSERIAGTSKELWLLLGGLETYCAKMATAEGPLMRAIRAKLEGEDWDGLWQRRESLFPYGPEASTDPVEAQAIKMFTLMKAPKCVLEVGMFAGYGAAAILEGLPSGGTLISLDIDPFLKKWVEEVTSKFDEGKKHEIITGPALETLPTVSHHKFDLVFVDANKSEYKAYIEMLLQRDMLAPNAMIIVDNTLYNAMPFMPAEYDTQPKRRVYADDTASFNEWLRTHPELMQVILPIRDGVTFLCKR